MTTGTALVVVLVSLVAVNVWVHVGPRQAHLVTGPLGAVGLIAVARSSASRSRTVLSRSGSSGRSLVGGFAPAGRSGGTPTSYSSWPPRCWATEPGMPALAL